MIYNKLLTDQRECVDTVRDRMRNHKNILLQSCTGSGKTYMAMAMIEMAYHKSAGNIIFTVPRKALLDQTSDSFNGLGINHSYIASGKPFNKYSRVFIGMIPTMASRLDELPEAKILFIDETHYGDGYLNKIINHYKARGTYIIGLSATPWRSSGKGLGCYYDNMVTGKSMRWLIDNKRLSEYRYFAGKTAANFDQLRITAGEYNRKDASEYMEGNKAIIGDCVRDYKEKAYGKIHAVRCQSVKHSGMTAQAFMDNGVTARHVDGDTPKTELKQIIMAYARREIKVLTFCDLLTFGFDLSQYCNGMDVCIESGDDMKPNKSLAEWIQFIGRFLRMKDEPALIFDRVNNHIEHGMPCAEREWSLMDRVQGKRGGEDAQLTKTCKNCFAIYKPRSKCPECGEKSTKERKIETIDGELEELDPRAVKAIEVKERKQEQGQARTLEELIAVGKSRGMKNPYGWASQVLKGRRR